jgi:hypothetical protein
MSMLFKCPPGTYLGGIVPTECPIKWDQTQKIAFGRKYANRFSSAGVFNSQVGWQALLDAITDARLVITPYVSNLVIPASEVLSQGGNDNTTIDGVREVTGIGFVTVTAQLKNISAETAEEIRLIGTESMIQPGVSNIVGYFLQTGDAVVWNKTSTGTKYDGFEIFNLTLTDIGNEGLNTNTVYNLSFDMKGGWSQWWGYQVLPFNPRDLENPAS